jgi:flagellar hook-basal body complex protein FliE
MTVNSMGHIVNLKATHDLHYGHRTVDKRKAIEKEAGTFSNMLSSAIESVNSQQVQSEELVQKMIYQPESVDIHNVMISAQKAELSLTMMKTIRDEAIRAFRDIINLR